MSYVIVISGAQGSETKNICFIKKETNTQKTNVFVYFVHEHFAAFCCNTQL